MKVKASIKKRSEDIAQLEQSSVTYGDFFRNAPDMNPARARITGKVCGVRVEEIQDQLMREIRYLDKLVDGFVIPSMQRF